MAKTPATRRTRKQPVSRRRAKTNRRSTSAVARATAAPAGPFTLRGEVDEAPSPSFLNTTEVVVQTKAQFRPSRARAAVVNQQAAQVADDDVVEIEFTEGHRVWMRADDYRAQIGGQAARGANADGLVTVTPDFPVLPQGMQSRGPVAWVIKSLKVLGVDLADKSAKKIAQAVENRARRYRPGVGLFHCELATGGFALKPAKVSANAGGTDAPHLLFIHGTASSTWGSFGDLWETAREAELAQLRKHYADRALAFEHQTLSASPLQNAVELATLLPNGAHLHIVTHSRGGLIAELLSRAGCDEPFSAEEIACYDEDERYREARTDGKSELDWLRALDKVLRAKRLVVERCVRVGCPALGTTLASGRLDRWLSVVGSIAGSALPNTPMAEAFADIGDFVAAVVQQRTDPRSLPGLEAMMPDAALMRLINWPTTVVPGDLTVVAGDIEPDAWWSRLLVWATDRFYEGDHDLVVNTASMFGGTRRSGDAMQSEHEGPSVYHFTYFRNAESARQIVRALTRNAGDISGFEQLERREEEIARGVEAAREAARAVLVNVPPEPRPVVFLLPGIMGSELFIGRDKVWIGALGLVAGGLGRLAIGAKNVKPFQPIVRNYGELHLFLKRAGHKVIDFAYDWRLHPEKEAQRLADSIREELKTASATGQPVRIIAHSMGGLIARTMIGLPDSPWKDMCRHPSARLMMMGTPTRGAHAITQLLFGRASLLAGLARIDFRHDLVELLEIISRFPGVLCLLPKDPLQDWLSIDTWREYQRLDGRGWVLPRAEDLAELRGWREAMDNAPVEAERMIYVAGSADATLASMSYDKAAGEYRFMATTRGDGQVTWDDGIPQGMPTWYTEIRHGDLCANVGAFPAIQELLETGRTTLLPQSPRQARGADTLFPMPPAADELYPTEEVLEALAVGASPRKQRTRARMEPPVHVGVVHGNLKFAKHIVAVGHYQGDTLINAEKALDGVLGGQLSRRHQLRLYPGALETSAYFENEAAATTRWATPKGALVVGLGTPGLLSVQKLTSTLTRGLLDFVIEWKERHPRGLPATNAAGQPSAVLAIAAGEPVADDRGIGISMLLIGTSTGGLKVADAVYAVLLATARANGALASVRETVRIKEVEIIELWEDRALQAADALGQVASDPEIQGRFQIELQVSSTSGGRRRRSYSDPGGWWHRVQILGNSEPGTSAVQPLRFAATTRRARSEVRLLATQRALVEQFVVQTIGTTRDNREISKALYELLIPNDLKEQAPDQDDIVLLLDEAAAAYPWELIQDPLGRGDPFVIEHGVLRQLETATFRENVMGATELAALVVGDPLLGSERMRRMFPPLAGACREAEGVTKALQSNGTVRVEALIRRSGDDIINALFKRPYRILHFAGHGVYRMPREQLAAAAGPGAPDDVLTGMVVGDDYFLTPGEVRQMRRVPEFVFINCCHLGRIEAGRDNYLAANLATEFIKMGVRAVVAAGWAVDDEAALTFATELYRHLLSGTTYGMAVKRARAETYARHSSTNTWGAYQCYGDPDFRLLPAVEADYRDVPTPALASPEHAVSEILDLRDTLVTLAASVPAWQIDQLRNIQKELTRLGWLELGTIRVALGRAFADALCFEEALQHYQQAFAREPSSMTTRDIEQMANLLSRSALSSWLRSGGKADAREVQATERSLQLIEWLLRPPVAMPEQVTAKDVVAEPGATVERLSLLASTYKRRAWMGIEVEQSLHKMAATYARALALAVSSNADAQYPQLNELFSRLVLDWFGLGEAPLTSAQLAAQLAPLRTELDKRLERRKQFWDAAMGVEATLLEALVAGTLDEHHAALCAQYLEARKLASPREFASVFDQVGFLYVMATLRKPEIAALFERLGRVLADGMVPGEEKAASRQTAKPPEAKRTQQKKRRTNAKRRIAESAAASH